MSQHTTYKPKSPKTSAHIMESPILVVVAEATSLIIWLVALAVLVYTVRSYRKKHTWINFWQLVISCLLPMFQAINAAMAYTNSDALRRTLWILCLLIMALNVGFQFWRFKIFNYVVETWFKPLTKPRVAFSVSSFLMLILTWPVIAYVIIGESEFLLKLGTLGQIWAQGGILMWRLIQDWSGFLLCYAGCKFTLWKADKSHTEKQIRYRGFGRLTLIAMAINTSVISISTVAREILEEFPYPRASSSLWFSGMVLHISLSYVVNVCIVHFMSHAGKKLKFSRKSTQTSGKDSPPRKHSSPTVSMVQVTNTNQGFTGENARENRETAETSSHANYRETRSRSASNNVPATPTLLQSQLAISAAEVSSNNTVTVMMLGTPSSTPSHETKHSAKI